jgi:hypothetical protein
MKNISIIFSKASTFFPIFSWLIMLTERTPYSHVAMKVQDVQTGITLYYQASHTMVNTMSEDQFLAQESIVYSFDFGVDDNVAIAIRRFVQINMGIPYGKLAILGLTYVQFLKLFKINIKNPFKTVGKEYVCSQFIGATVEKATNITLPVDVNDLTPVMFYPIVENLPKIWLGNKNVTI